MKTLITRTLLLILAGASVAFAQNRVMPSEPALKDDTTINRTNADGELKRGDRRFFRQAARLGEHEVLLSRAAAERATTPQVQAFAAEMVREHTASNEELMALAGRKGATLETRDRTEARAEEKKWAEKSGKEFDEDYLEAIIDGHQDMIDVLENGVDSKDPEIAAYANKHLPAVRSHLARAETLEKAVD